MPGSFSACRADTDCFLFCDQDIGQTVFLGDLSYSTIVIQLLNCSIDLLCYVRALAESDAILLLAEVVVQINGHVCIIGAFTDHGQCTYTVNHCQIRCSGLDFHQSLCHGIYRDIIAVLEVFLCGDFNDTPGSLTLGVFSGDWQLLSDTSYSFSSIDPHVCIDYILVLKNMARVKPIKSEVMHKFESGDVKHASDHLPVYVKVRILSPSSGSAR